MAHVHLTDEDFALIDRTISACNPSRVFARFDVTPKPEHLESERKELWAALTRQVIDLAVHRFAAATDFVTFPGENLSEVCFQIPDQRIVGFYSDDIEGALCDNRRVAEELLRMESLTPDELGQVVDF